MATTSRDSVSATAPAWEQRFRASAILLSTIAIDAPDVGLVSSNASGIPQLYRWDTASGALTQLTFDEGGRVVGRLSPDGRWVTWLADTSGNEIGHWVVIPSGGRRARSTSAPSSRRTPRSRSRSAGTVAGSGSSRPRTTGSRSGSRSSATTGGSGELQTVHHSTADLTALALSADGAIAAFSSAHRSKGVEHSILTADTARGEPGPELWDGPGHEHPGPLVRPGRRRPPPRSRRPTRRAASGRSSGTRRRATAATCRRMPPAATSSSSTGRPTAGRSCSAGSTRPSTGCSSGTSSRTRSASSTTRPAPSGLSPRDVDLLSGPTAREIVCRWEDFGQPRRLIGLDPQTGRQTQDDPRERRRAARARAAQRLVPDDRRHGPAPGLARRAEGEAPFPVILETHGGPTAATFPSFHPQAQAFLDDGYAFLSLNYRGLDDVRARVRARDLGPARRARDPGHGGRPDVADRQRASPSPTGSSSRAGRTAGT